MSETQVWKSENIAKGRSCNQVQKGLAASLSKKLVELFNMCGCSHFPPFPPSIILNWPLDFQKQVIPLSWPQAGKCLTKMGLSASDTKLPDSICCIYFREFCRDTRDFLIKQKRCCTLLTRSLQLSLLKNRYLKKSKKKEKVKTQYQCASWFGSSIQYCHFKIHHIFILLLFAVSVTYKSSYNLLKMILH